MTPPLAEAEILCEAAGMVACGDWFLGVSALSGLGHDSHSPLVAYYLRVFKTFSRDEPPYGTDKMIVGLLSAAMEAL